MRPPHAMKVRPDASGIAIAALSHFATDQRVLDRFFAVTGLDSETLRRAANTPGFFAGVLDFVLEDERLLLAVAEEQQIPPEAIVNARRALNERDADVDDGRCRAHTGDDDWPPPPPVD
ncbi:MAG: DUF3572 domain-containing protein [Devosia sp.]